MLNNVILPAINTTAKVEENGEANRSNNEGSKQTLSPAPRRARDFFYGKILGMGSFSKVILATFKRTGEDFALKVMDKRHIIREGKIEYVKLERLILDELDHPGIIRLHFTFQDDRSLYMGMECCYGGELFHQIKERGRIPFEHAQFYAAEVLDILEYIHNHGIIHRDIKPENLLLGNDGHIKLIDFGSAKLLRPLDGANLEKLQDERNCSFVGTAEYVSPEVLNSQPVTFGADMWALGCVIYFMMEGRPPFKAASEYLCFQKVMARDFVMPDHFSEETQSIINQLLDMDPKKRLGTGPEGHKELKKHPFFEGINWDTLWESEAPPSIALLSDSSEDEEGDSDEIDEECEFNQMVSKFSRVVGVETQSERSTIHSSQNPLSPNSRHVLLSPTSMRKFVDCSVYK